MKFFCIPIFACKSGIHETFDFSQLRLEEVPKEVIKSKKLVEELLLNVNLIETLPPEFFRCTKLRLLDVSENKLKVLPPEIGALQQLADLNLSKNELVELPEEIGQCRSLVSLDVSTNIVPGLPKSIVKLCALAHLNISNNSLTQLPQDIDLLINLQHLDAGQCELRLLPATIVSLRKLKVLDLCENYLTELPTGMNGLLGLEVLDLHNNMILKLPDDLLECKALRTLDVSTNNIAYLPENIGDLENLTDLVLSENRIVSLPSSIGKLKKLEVLKVSKNSLTELTPAICSCYELTDLVLCENQLRELPSSIGNLKKLKFLDVNVNQLKEIPSTIGGCSSLGVLALRKNEIRELPMEIGRLDRLHVLDMTDNNLTYLPYTITVLYQYKTLSALWLSHGQPPLPKLTVTHEPVMNVKVLTCYLLPQNSHAHGAFAPASRSGVEGGPRVKWEKGLIGEEMESEEEEKVQPGRFARMDTPHPKPFAPKNRLSRNSGDFSAAVENMLNNGLPPEVLPSQNAIESRPLRSVLKRPPSTSATQLMPSDTDINSDMPIVTKNICITRGANGIGWHIVGGSDSPLYKGQEGVFVSLIVPNSVADNAGFLVDDRIVTVNGKDLREVTHSEAVEIIKTAGNVLNVVVERRLNETLSEEEKLPTILNEMGALSQRQSMESLPSLHATSIGASVPKENRETLSLTVVRDLNGSPGFSIRGGEDICDPFCVDSFVGGLQSSRLRVGDRLLSINGVNVKTATRKELEKLLNGPPGTEIYVVADREAPTQPRLSAFTAVGSKRLAHARSLPSLAQEEVLQAPTVPARGCKPPLSARSTNNLAFIDQSLLPDIPTVSSASDKTSSNTMENAMRSFVFTDEPLATSSPIPPAQNLSRIPRLNSAGKCAPPPPPKPKNFSPALVIRKTEENGDIKSKIPDRTDFCSKLQKFEQQSSQSTSALPTLAVRNGSGIPAKKPLISAQDLEKLKAEEAKRVPPLAVLDEILENGEETAEFSHILNDSPVPSSMPSVIRTRKAELRAERANGGGDISSSLNGSMEMELSEVTSNGMISRTPSSLSSIEQRISEQQKRQAWRQARLQSMDTESKRTDQVIQLMNKIPPSPIPIQ